jgi:hypothetical protein
VFVQSEDGMDSKLNTKQETKIADFKKDAFKGKNMESTQDQENAANYKKVNIFESY